MRSCDTGFRTNFVCEIYQVSEALSKGCVPLALAMAELSGSRGGSGVAKGRDRARKSAGATACIKARRAGESPMGANLSRVDDFQQLTRCFSLYFSFPTTGLEGHLVVRRGFRDS